MSQAFRIFARVVAGHWPALMAWYLGGEALHRVLIELAGFVGGHTTLGGLLLLPLAVAARLVSYVAMYLTVRPSLPHSRREDAGGIREFASATLTAILPFFAFYTAWGLLDADQIEFFQIANSLAVGGVGYDPVQRGDRGGLIAFGVLPVAVLLVAFVARLLFARYAARLPRWTIILATYAEALWTFMLFMFVARWWSGVLDWFSQREAVGWLRGVGDWFAVNLAPVAIVWEGAVWVVGILVAALIVPAAWLTVAGVIFGTTFDSTPSLGRWGGAAARGAARSAAMSVARTLVMRLEGLWAAVTVIWRGGPLLYGAYALSYAAWALAEQAGTRAVFQLIGGHEASFWAGFFPLVTVAVAAVTEPLRVAIVVTAYDGVLGRPRSELDTRPSGVDVEPGQIVVAALDVEPERPGDVVGKQEDEQDAVSIRLDGA
ncbi:hypothetical protein [Microbacterium foliorum]|uniref:hypothetical protein n=1 Tax=Microbacterium foliorum TaxID=104336 RepID=UPI001D22FAAB|nr:hypothetical protein [Microbacterium foliorum]CAH0169078.1 hypothetical protein SRABI03_01202 [Microbacterium foliorum]CAH0192429.1 hypothetical protein SRABI44_01721 [Microbacterium foliorum]